MSLKLAVDDHHDHGTLEDRGGECAQGMFLGLLLQQFGRHSPDTNLGGF